MNPEAIAKALPEIVTQLIAFILVFWILKKYAFSALFRIMDERRRSIADSFRQIEEKKADLERLEKEYSQKIREIEQEARLKIQEAVQDGNRIAREIKEKTRQDALKQLERVKFDIEQEVAKARVMLRNRIVELSARLAEKVIRKNIALEGDEAFNEDILKEVESDILKEAHKK